MLRTKNLKESAESEASVYVGLPLISFVEKIVTSCVVHLEEKKMNAERKTAGL